MADIIRLPSHADQRGLLTVIDGILPFAIKRVYYLYKSTGKPRGGHRHRKTVQALVSVAGRCVVDWDNGREKGVETLDSPEKLLVVRPEDWHVMRDFTADSVLLVFASEPFDPSDYIDEGYDT
jgi:hypothetical protein